MDFRIPVVAAFVLVAACGEGGGRIVEPLHEVVTPSCTSPARLLGYPDPRLPDSYLVAFHAGTDAAATAAALEQKYGFRAKSVWTSAIQGFAATLTSNIVAGLRCEPAVDLVEYDAVVSIAG